MKTYTVTIRDGTTKHYVNPQVYTFPDAGILRIGATPADFDDFPFSLVKVISVVDTSS
jgi:hypothetical protein